MKPCKFGKIRPIGIIGAGMVADFHAKAIREMETAELAGFCDSGSGRAKRLAKKYGCRAYGNYEEMLADNTVEIVTIATPSGFHMEPAVAAAKAGKHVICEKPLEISRERMDAMIAAHEEAGTRLGGIFQNRFLDAMTPLRHAVQAGRFGTITFAGAYVPWWRSKEYYENPWRGTWKMDGGGALMNQAIHTVDMLCELMPPIESVQAITGKAGHPQIEAEDTAAAVLQFTGGALGFLYGTTASFPGSLRRFEITGTKGTAVFVEDHFTHWSFAEETSEDERIRSLHGQTQSGGGAADPASISYENHKRNFLAFVDALDRRQPFCLDAAEARKAVEVVLAVYESAQKGKKIFLAG